MTGKPASLEKNPGRDTPERRLPMIERKKKGRGKHRGGKR
jgi:hypothetical protein